ncbi:uncharacterized protein LOC118481018 [Helianthus annuus]|uniref:uncharacterized protein LOC118481018 n=1 Tax=Helianthus annuus TaxID=4232 RepID=UPI001652F4CF|nr:uncharacterized protein LOC118481018 [Helianthus annuus]
MSAAPGPSHEFVFDHEVDDDLDPTFPPDFDPEQDIEFIHMDQPLEAPVAPIDPLFDIPADFDMDLVDPEPVMAPEPIVDHDPVLDDAPADAPPDMGAPAIAPLVDDIPIVDLPVVAPPLMDDLVVDAPLPDPMPVLFDRAPFAAHIDPRYADTRNGWIDDDDDNPPFVLPVTPPVAPVSAPTDIPLFPPHTTDAHRTYLPITFLQDIPPPRPGEGSSRQPPVSAPPMLSSPFPFTCLVAGKIGNSELTKEDYDQIDPEEMELIDIQEDRNDIVRKTAHGKATTAPRKFANVAEIKEEKEPAKNHEEKIENKEKTREEILSEKTHKERDVVYRRMDEMQEEYENAVSNKRWDKKRERVTKDDAYVKQYEKDIRYAMLSCLRKRDEEKMKKSIEEMVVNLKKVAEEVETEAVKVEAVKEVEEQQIEEEEMKDVKSDAGDVGKEVSVEQKLNDAEMKQPEKAENNEVPNTEVFLKKTECQSKEKRSSLAPEAADPCNG